MSDEKPYLEKTITVVEKTYNPNYGDDRVCHCGHKYYRHFDTYERMANVGCKYCFCHDFREADMSTENIERMRVIVRENYPTEDIDDFIDDTSAWAVERVMEFHFNFLVKQEFDKHE